jgi:hypothetical protein
MISLDLYLAYIRAAFHTCYYCSIVSDHVEELQRKCLAHARKPLSVKPSDEGKSIEVEKKNNDDKEKDPEKDHTTKEKIIDSRDWKRNGACNDVRSKSIMTLDSDDRWLEWLDSKIALLIDRDNVDPRDYGGKNYDECVQKLMAFRFYQ